jgi:hypothetical protein
MKQESWEDCYVLIFPFTFLKEGIFLWGIMLGSFNFSYGQNYSWVAPLGTSKPKFLKPIQLQDNIGFT